VPGWIRAETVMVWSRRLGFAGPVWQVHWSLCQICGLHAFQPLVNLPGVPDAGFMGGNRHVSLPAVSQLAVLGAGTAPI
jgi:acetate---CoA ligase (ADP-forming)